jgi:hypothetical protein
VPATVYRYAVVVGYTFIGVLVVVLSRDGIAILIFGGGH